MSAEFTLSLNTSAASSGGSVDFVDLRATVACRGYAGKTTFALARRDLKSYVADLSALREARAIAAQLIGGWDATEERLRLRITPAGRSGQFHARINMATTGPRTDAWQRVETDFICSPADLSDFLGALEDLSRGGPETAVLAGDEDAVA